MRHALKKLNVIASNKKVRFIAKFLCVIGLISVARSALANDSAGDLLAGTTTQALNTMNGSGRSWMYLIDGGISLAAFAKSKNPFVFASVLAIAVGITVIYKMAGGT